MNFERKVKLLEEKAQFLKAAKLIEKNIISLNNLDDKIYYNNRIKYLRENSANYSKNNIGEASFPVYDEAEKEGMILKLLVKFNKETRSIPRLTESWEKVKPLVSLFLNRFLEEKISNLYVFDWRLNEMNVGYLPLEHTPENEKLFDRIAGDSLQLALAAAAVSSIIKVKIPDNFVFSGLLEAEGGNTVIKSVKYLNEKIKALKTERPNSKLIVSEENLEEDDSFKKFGKLSEVIDELFPELKKYLKDLSELNKYNHIKLNLPPLTVKTSDNKYHSLVKVDMGEAKIKQEDFKSLYAFLKRNKNELSTISNGIIIDGLFINFASAMLTSLLKNNYSGFLAATYGQGKNISGLDNYKVAVVIECGNGSEREPGEVIYYENSSVF